MTRRIVVLATSGRLPAGQLTWPAWEVLRSGATVLTRPADRQLAPLRATGVELTTVEGDPVEALLACPGDVVWVAAPRGPGVAGDSDVVRRLGTHLVSHPDAGVLEVLHGTVEPAGAALLDVVAVMDQLRSPGGCPWDAQQTHESLAPYLVEESWELLEAIESGDREALREELGDVLLQVAFHARLAEEHDAPWSMGDVAGDLVDKLVRRHPHVFAGASADDLEGSWDRLKAAEKQRASVTDGVPLGQPALSLASALQRRATRLGAGFPAYDGLGGELWSIVARCREEGLDPEAELRAVAKRFRDRLAEVERELIAEGRATASVSAQEWREALSP